MRRSWRVPVMVLSAVSTAVLAWPGAVSAATAAPANIIKNPGAEAGPGSADGSTVPVPHWTVPAGGTFTAVQYGAGGGFPAATDPGPPNRGANFFAGGPASSAASATQTDSLSAYTGIIASGATFTLKGWLGGFENESDHATVTVVWKSSTGAKLGSVVIGPVTPAQRKDATGLLQRVTTGAVPAGSVKAVVTMKMTRKQGTYNDGYADNLSLTIAAS